MPQFKQKFPTEDYRQRFQSLPDHYKGLVNSFQNSYAIDFTDPQNVNEYLNFMKQSLAQESGQRPGAESSMRNNINAVENLFNHLYLGKDIPGGIFDLPEYKQTKGYR